MTSPTLDVSSRPAPRRSIVLAAIFAIVAPVVAVVVVRHVGPAEPAATDAAPTPSAGRRSAQQAEQLLATVPVRGRAPKTGYRRDRFGPGWASVGGCDLRNRTLARDLTEVRFRPGTRNCVVESGVLADPYSGVTIAFRRGPYTSTLVEIDHRYPLALAWQQGAQQWTDERRIAFANDPDNLQAVSARANESKGASGPGSWLPPQRDYRCTYVITFVEVTARWQLSMNPGDHGAAARVLDRCD